MRQNDELPPAVFAERFRRCVDGFMGALLEDPRVTKGLRPEILDALDAALPSPRAPAESLPTLDDAVARLPEDVFTRTGADQNSASRSQNSTA